ncbi:MAG: A/G-specific adenine glycosylase [Planctomycetota bacterium]
MSVRGGGRGRGRGRSRRGASVGEPEKVAEGILSSESEADGEELPTLSGLQLRVLLWYDMRGRRLPWRETRDPYRIWLSEIMLQQTTVSAVVPYFQRFIERFPTVGVLAAAPLEEVLRCWEGLGYYSRARNLHRAAGLIVSEHGGEFPRSVEGLTGLPGIGRYTAGAIAAFAWDLPAAILEANTERLYARLMCLEESVDTSAGRKRLWEYAESIVPGERAGEFNQSLMDIGSGICIPKKPQCGECPLWDYCAARRAGREQELPRRRPRVGITELSELAVVLESGGRVLVRRRGMGERWAGMYDFPRLELSESQREFLPEAERLVVRGRGRVRGRSGSLFAGMDEGLSGELGVLVESITGVRPLELLGSVSLTYSVTRFRVSLVAIRCRYDGEGELRDDFSWQDAGVLDGLPMPTAARQIVGWLRDERKGV